MSTANEQTPAEAVDPIQHYRQMQDELARLAARRSVAANEIDALQAEIATAKGRVRDAKPTVAELLSDPLELPVVPNHNEKIAELTKLISHIDDAYSDIFNQVEIAARAASIEMIKGPAGDKWRSAVKELHERARQVVVASERVEREHQALQGELPRADALWHINFPDVSSDGWAAKARLESFERRLLDLDKRYS